MTLKRDRAALLAAVVFLCLLSVLVPTAAFAQRVRVRSLAGLGYTNGLTLEGTSSEQTVAFRVPAHTRLDSARLALRVHFPRTALPQSNLQVFANNTRVGSITRGQGDTSGTATLTSAIPSALFTTDFLTVSFRSSVATVADRCLDDRLSMSWVTLDAGSTFSFSLPDSAISSIRQAWAVLPDTVTVGLPRRRLTPAEFGAALNAAMAVSDEGHTLRFSSLPDAADVMVAARTDLAAISTDGPPSANLALVHTGVGRDQRIGIFIDAAHGGTASAFLGTPWTTLTAQRSLAFSGIIDASTDVDAERRDNPTFADLRMSDLSLEVGGEAAWRIPVDIRHLAAGRVPTGAELRLVTAPNTGDRQLVLYAFFNGTLVRSADVNVTGASQTVDVHFPSALVTTRNELRVLVQRHQPSGEACSQSDPPMPAQLLPSSRVLTTSVKRGAAVFTAVAARIDEESPIDLPADALDHPDTYLPVVVRLGRAFWATGRVPKLVFYGPAAPPKPSRTFVLVGSPNVDAAGPVSPDSAGAPGRLRVHQRNGNAALLDIADLSAWSVIQVVRWNGETGLQLLPRAGARGVPDYPDAYGASTLTLANADSSVFQLNTANRDESALFDDGPGFFQRLSGNWILWALFIILVGGPVLVLTARAVIRRTPRRRLARGFDRGTSPTPPVP